MTISCRIVGAGVAFAENIVIKGSTTVLPIAQVILEAYRKANSGANISLSGGGSGEGIKALVDESAHITNSPREIEKTEAVLAKSSGAPVGVHHHACAAGDHRLSAGERINAEKPELIILDLMMPGLPGMEVCRMIRRQESTASLLVIMLTEKSAIASPILKILLDVQEFQCIIQP